jgi:hypothetical protein
MTLEYRKRCLEYALELCRGDAIVNMTDDEIIAEWGFQRSPAGPLHAAAPRIAALEAENAALREALKPFAKIAIQAEQAWTSGQYYAPEDYVRPAIRLKHFTEARAALAGSGEK